MENMEEIKGYIIYKPDTIKEIVPEGDQQLMDPFELEIIKKFEGKIV